MSLHGKGLALSILFLSLQIPSLRPLAKYLPGPVLIAVPACLLLLALSYVAASKRIDPKSWLVHVLSCRALPFVVFILLLAVSFVGYPLADSLKANMRGSDQDDAVIQTGLRLVAGLDPYGAPTYLGNPPSPGPGWIMALLPFSVTGLYFALTPVAVTITAYALSASTQCRAAGSAFVCALMTSLSFWELMITGSDLLAAGCVITLCALLVYHRWNRSLSDAAICVCLAAVASTIRVVFLYITTVLAALLWPRSRRDSILFAIASASLSIAIQLAIFAWNPQSYTPLHLLSKGSGIVGIGMLGAVAVFCIVRGPSLLLRMGNELDSWLLGLWTSIAAPMFLVSMGDLLAVRSLDLTSWEGANYLAIPMVIYVAYFCTKVCGPSGRIASNAVLPTPSSSATGR